MIAQLAAGAGDVDTYLTNCFLVGTFRLKIAKKGLGPDVMLSRQTLLNCGAFEDFGGGCGGGESALGAILQREQSC